MCLLLGVRLSTIAFIQMAFVCGHAIFTRTSKEPFLLFSRGSEVLKEDFDTVKTAHNRSSFSLNSTIKEVVALDYDYAKSTLIFIAKKTAKGPYALFFSSFGSRVRKLSIPLKGAKRPGGLGWDWRHSTLYWTESQRIHVYRFMPSRRNTHQHQRISVPRLSFGTLKSIAVNPRNNHVYFTTSKGLFKMKQHEWSGEAFLGAIGVTSMAIDYHTGDVYYHYNQTALGCFECQTDSRMFVDSFTRGKMQIKSLLAFFNRTLYFTSHKGLLYSFSLNDRNISKKSLHVDHLKIVSRKMQSSDEPPSGLHGFSFNSFREHSSPREHLFSMKTNSFAELNPTRESMSSEVRTVNPGNVVEEVGLFEEDGNEKGVAVKIIASASGSAVLVFIILLFICVWQRKHKRHSTPLTDESLAKDTKEERPVTKTQNLYEAAPSFSNQQANQKEAQPVDGVFLDNPNYEGVFSPPVFPGSSRESKALNNPCYDGIDFADSLQQKAVVKPKSDSGDNEAAAVFLDNPNYDGVRCTSVFFPKEDGRALSNPSYDGVDFPKLRVKDVENPSYERVIVSGLQFLEERVSADPPYENTMYKNATIIPAASQTKKEDDSYYEPVEVKVSGHKTEKKNEAEVTEEAKLHSDNSQTAEEDLCNDLYDDD